SLSRRSPNLRSWAQTCGRCASTTSFGIVEPNGCPGRRLKATSSRSAGKDRAAQAEPKLTADGQLAEALSVLLPAAWRVIGSPTMATGLSPRNPLLSASESATLTSAG